jgi:hypothetical protein
MIEFLFANEKEIQIEYLPSYRSLESVFYDFEFQEGFEMNCGTFEFICREGLFDHLRNYVEKMRLKYDVIESKTITRRRIKEEFRSEKEKIDQYNLALNERIHRLPDSSSKDELKTQFKKYDESWYERYSVQAHGMIRFTIDFDTELFRLLEKSGFCKS